MVLVSPDCGQKNPRRESATGTKAARWMPQEK
jgi:hypothetical protein